MTILGNITGLRFALNIDYFHHAFAKSISELFPLTTIGIIGKSYRSL